MRKILSLGLCLAMTALLASCAWDSAQAQVKHTVGGIQKAGSLSAELKIIRSSVGDTDDQNDHGLYFTGFLDVEQALGEDMRFYLELPSYEITVETVTERKADSWREGYTAHFLEPYEEEVEKERREITTKYLVYYRNSELFFTHNQSRVAVGSLDPIPSLRLYALAPDSFESLSFNSEDLRISFAVAANSVLHRQLNALCANLFGETLNSISAPSGTLKLDLDGRPRSLTLEFTDLFPADGIPYNYSVTLDNFRYPAVQEVRLPPDLDSYPSSD